MENFNTNAGIGLTLDGVEINSFKGVTINHGKITKLTIDINGSGYKIPNNINENIPPISIDGVQYNNLINIYGSLNKIDIEKIPAQYLTGFEYPPNIIINNAIGDNTGSGMEITADYTVDGNIIGFTIVNSGKYYTEIPDITIIDGGKHISPYTIPKESIVILGSIGVKRTYTNDEVNLDSFNPLTQRDLDIPNTVIYTDIPSVTLSVGTGASGVVNLVGGVVSSVTIDSAGDNYTSPPSVIFYDLTGRSASATTTITNGKVTSVNITNGGEKYSNFTTVQFNNNGNSAKFSAKIETWTYNLGINPFIDNIGGYVYDYSDSFCSTEQVPDTVNYPQYVQLKNIENQDVVSTVVNPNPTIYLSAPTIINPNPTIYLSVPFGD